MKKIILLTALSLAFCNVQLHAQPKKQALETVVDSYLKKYFNPHFGGLFTYVGNVELVDAVDRASGETYVEGRFEYKNLGNDQVSRKFRATITKSLGFYTVKKFECYIKDIEGNWFWEEI